MSWGSAARLRGRTWLALGALLASGTALMSGAPAVAAGNDSFAAATEVPRSLAVDISTAGASTEAGEPLGCGQRPGKTVWFHLQLPAEGFFEADVVTNGFTPFIAVYTGPALDRLTRLGCEASSAGNATSVGGNNNPAGDYWFQIGGRDGAGGDVHVEITSRDQSGSTGDVSGAVLPADECAQNLLPRNDDNSSTQVPLPFPVDFLGRVYDSTYVNNNGNITFDAPLSTFTPFGLTSTSRVIVAPFFGDVDTRASASGIVAYGWGNTLYEGHRAFCVNWVDVGYYSYGTDKLNSFQLLLVEREDAPVGSFDIVFNYDRIEWEAGSASGGTNGLGGSPARAGFSNGSGEVGTSYELPGSGVVGAFLDSNAATGLRYGSTPGEQPGRYRYGVRSSAPPPSRYVAMGDSFQSGEGSYDYEPGTDVNGTNRCHRSPSAYPRRLVLEGYTDFELSFVACSGAVIDDLSDNRLSTSGVPYNEGAQFDDVDLHTGLVTIGIGGNDMKFGGVLEACIKSTVVDPRSCQSKHGEDVDQSLLDLIRHDPTDRLNRLQRVYQELRRRAPRARIVVLGYPRFFVPGGAADDAPGTFLFPGVLGDIIQYKDLTQCSGIRLSDQRWINDEIEQFDEQIARSARSMGAEYVDTFATPAGHELCSGNEEFMNGLAPPPEAYHPNSFGHSLLARAVGGQLAAGAPGTTYVVRPGATVTTTQTVPQDTPYLTFSTTWPGSDVVLSLVSPSGRVIERGTSAQDVVHTVGPTFETYALERPEPGTWTIRMFGADVAPKGEPTVLDVHVEPRANVDPIPVISVSQQGRHVVVDSSESRDADGRIVRWDVEFGDGALGNGEHLEHSYAKPGSYEITLTVRDNDGGEATTAWTQVIDIPSGFAFSGFLDPVAPKPTVNDVQAGRTIPLRFSLDGYQGMDVLEPGAPGSRPAACDGSSSDPLTPAASASKPVLKYDADEDAYSFTWQTERSWSGCRDLVLTLSDGSTHTALFDFRRPQKEPTP